MKKIICLLVAISFVLIFASCSLVGLGSPSPSGAVSSSYPDSVVYKIKLSNDTYFCSSFTVSNTDTQISLQLTDVYSLGSDGKITWVGKDKTVSAVAIEKVTK
jgi:hypothetical protein